MLEFEGKRQGVFVSSLDEHFGGELKFFPRKPTKGSRDMSSLLKDKDS